MIVIDNEKIQVIKLALEIENTGHITNCYLIKDKLTSKVCVIDPAFNSSRIKNELDNINGIIDTVIITHSHADHIAAVANLVKETEAKVYIHAKDFDGLYSKRLNEEDVVQTKVLTIDREKVNVVEDKEIITFGSVKLEVIHTPGHTKGSICLLDDINNILYSGDTIFEKSYGRTDLICGSNEEMKQTLDKLFKRFEDIQVLPGHGNSFNLKDSKRIIRLLFAYKG